MISPGLVLLGRRRRYPLPLWLVIVRLVVLLGVVVVWVSTITMRIHENTRRHKMWAAEIDALKREETRERAIRDAINSRETCVTFSEDGDVIEHFKPRHWDFGKYGSGDVCDESRYKVPGVHGQL